MENPIAHSKLSPAVKVGILNFVIFFAAASAALYVHDKWTAPKIAEAVPASPAPAKA